jgi:hypothetical protein
MTLSPGTRLGSYEIVAPLGAGGMGDVYRARDVRLDRSVAIKILPAEFSADRDRLRRFEQETRSASALNHPNIVTVYELGQDGSSHYLAMELVEGKTLRELLASGPLPIRKAIEIAAQAAEGLAKAHEADIAHRDLKPENLISPTGQKNRRPYLAFRTDTDLSQAREPGSILECGSLVPAFSTAAMARWRKLLSGCRTSRKLVWCPS